MTSTPKEITTVSTVLEKLHAKKQDHEFIITHQGFTAGRGKFYHPEDLKIIKTYFFDGSSNPSASSILYLIETNDGLKGYSLDAYGAYNRYKDEVYSRFIKEIPAVDKEEECIF
jgi:hypothetical protein